MINFFYRRCVFPAVLLFLLMNCACGQNKKSDDVSGSLKKKLGLRSGFNLLSLPRLKTADQTLNSNTGFFAGGYYSLPAKRIGYRSELIFSRQGYDYKTRTQTGNVKLDYIMLPQLMTFNISRFLQLHAGGQIAFLLHADVDSSANPSSAPYLMAPKNYYNKINYGFAGGLEVKPFAGFLLGGRYNLFFNLLKEAHDSPAYLPAYSGNLKNGLWQLYVGYEF